MLNCTYNYYEATERFEHTQKYVHSSPHYCTASLAMFKMDASLLTLITMLTLLPKACTVYVTDLLKSRLRRPSEH